MFWFCLCIPGNCVHPECSEVYALASEALSPLLSSSQLDKQWKWANWELLLSNGFNMVILFPILIVSKFSLSCYKRRFSNKEIFIFVCTRLHPSRLWNRWMHPETFLLHPRCTSFVVAPRALRKFGCAPRSSADLPSFSEWFLNRFLYLLQTQPRWFLENIILGINWVSNILITK